MSSNKDLEKLTRDVFLQVSNSQWDDATDLIRAGLEAAYRDGYNEGLYQEHFYPMRITNAKHVVYIVESKGSGKSYWTATSILCRTKRAAIRQMRIHRSRLSELIDRELKFRVRGYVPIMD